MLRNSCDILSGGSCFALSSTVALIVLAVSCDAREPFFPCPSHTAGGNGIMASLGRVSWAGMSCRASHRNSNRLHHPVSLTGLRPSWYWHIRTLRHTGEHDCSLALAPHRVKRRPIVLIYFDWWQAAWLRLQAMSGVGTNNFCRHRRDVSRGVRTCICGRFLKVSVDWVELSDKHLLSVIVLLLVDTHHI